MKKRIILIGAAIVGGITLIWRSIGRITMLGVFTGLFIAVSLIGVIQIYKYARNQDNG